MTNQLAFIMVEWIVCVCCACVSMHFLFKGRLFASPPSPGAPCFEHAESNYPICMSTTTSRIQQ